MSNIIKNKDTLLQFKDFLTYLSSHELSISFLEHILKENVPNNIAYNVCENGISTALFIPNTSTIYISKNKLDNWLDENTSMFLKDYPSLDQKLLKSYFTLLILTHEIEHSYEYLMGECLVTSPYKTIHNAYKYLYEILNPKETIFPNPIKRIYDLISIIKYKQKENYLLLERNAQIESHDLILKLALFNNDEDIYNFFNDMYKTFLTIGYLDSNLGSIEETFIDLKRTSLLKKVLISEEIQESDAIRYGFKISEESRQRLLKSSHSK